ncbi:glycosyltransferase [Nostoc sphaeroides CHAB 2801]|uniref:glycosyltransferase n=1 Tax=Nostoc sphaeroides TaxID=446679 RepID=UPI000E53F14D|nr:glycosyltransferase [Nostoc sphaeroides]MCC5629625.1 glycosyltransferase [Nostoc sphaeroides CHAB 2801]
MKIALVAGGYIPAPPLSNSILTLMQEYKYFLDNLGYEVDIFNDKNVNEVIDKINKNNYDFVHLHAYQFVSQFNQSLKQKYCFSCHNGYFLKKDKWEEDFKQGFQHYLNAPGIIALSHPTKDVFLQAGYSGYISTQVNGIDTQKFDFKDQGNNKAICLGWIQPRKQQKLLAEIINGKIAIDFVGPLDDPDFVEGSTTKYLGVWSLKDVYSHLTNYSCLVLISDGEVAPLVVLEAMAAGLSVVVSESASANLHSKDFIRVLPDDILTNATAENQKIVCDTITDLIDKNRFLRQEIVEYVRGNFDFSQIIKTYIQIIDEFIKFYY